MTVEILDVRRSDLRRNTLQNPFWITSGLITPAGDDLATLLFTFPKTAGAYSPGYNPFFIEACVFEVVTLFGGSASITVGTCTLVTDDLTTGDGLTVITADDFHASDDITEATKGYYPSSLTGADSPWTTAQIAGVATFPYYQTPVDGTTPGVYAALTGGPPTLGAARLHLCINEVP